MAGEEIHLIVMVGMVILAFLAVEIKDLMRAVSCFCGLSILLGLLYWLLNAPIVAFFQVLIYTTATIALFVFVIMLTTLRDEAE